MTLAQLHLDLLVLQLLSSAGVYLRRSSNAVLLRRRNYLLGHFMLQLLAIAFNFVLHQDVWPWVWHHTLNITPMLLVR